MSKAVKLKPYLTAAVYAAVVLLLVIFFIRFLDKYDIHDILADLESIPAYKKLGALGLTVLSFAVMSSYDFLGLKYAGASVGYGKVLPVSFISYAFGNALGLSVLASGSVRYRYYSALGLSFNDISKLIIFTSSTLWAGLIFISGLAFTLSPPDFSFGGGLAFINLRFTGIILLLMCAVYIALLYKVKEPLRIFSFAVPLPSVSLGLKQLILGCADWIVVSGVLYVLLPDMGQVSFFTFLSIFLIAQIAGFISNVPGGVLVFEAIFISLYPAGATAGVISALLVFRVTYYILPLVAAACIVGFSELIRLRSVLQKPILFAGRVYKAVTPPLMSAAVFIGGVALLVSGATPISHEKLPIMAHFIPLALLEFSHFLGSLAGMGLIILSRGLYKRIDLAYVLTMILLISGVMLSVPKGAAVSTFLLQCVIVAALIPTRSLYDRKSSFFSEVLTKEWFVTILLIFGAFTWLGFFSYKHVEYRNELWWSFAFDEQASRFLRAMVGAFTLIMSLAFLKLFQPSAKTAAYSGNRQEIEPIIAKSKDTAAFLAYLPDKRFLFDEDHDSFIMYGTEGRSFISMGDPVGSEDRAAELIFEFRRLSARHGCKAVFYEIGTEYIPHYMDAGMKIFKIGEKARVRLNGFSLEGSRHSSARNTLKRAEKEGAEFRIIPKEEVRAILPELRRLSDDWLKGKNTREKRFSLGCFDEGYLCRSDCAVVYVDGAPAAFANLWNTEQRVELSIDLMRYGNNAPKNIMEYLFLKLMLYGKEQGYEYFNLGMAPMSGFQVHSFSPVWNRLAGIIYKHGEKFYNFRGLRSYKEKFDPVWEPRYIAVEGVFSLPAALTGVAFLISGGPSGIFSK